MKDVSSVVARFTHVRLATPEDNIAILTFLRTQVMVTAEFSLGFERSPDFFALYRLSSHRYETFLFLNDNGSIGGIGSLLFQSRLFQGQPEQVGYFCDLRVDSRASRSTHFQWRDFYAQLAKELLNFSDSTERCRLLYTSVFDSNLRAVNSLTKKLRGIRYVPFHAYVAKTLILDPLCFSHSDQIVHESTIENDWWERQAQLFQFGPADWSNHLKENTSFSSLMNSSRQRIATCKPWINESVRSPTVGALSPGLDFLGRAMKILGRPPIRPHERLKQIFLTHLTFDPDLGLQQKEQALQKLIDSSYRKAIREGIHLVSWIEPRSHSFKRKVQPRIIFDVPAQLYEVVADGEVIQTESLRSAPVYFEGAVL